IHLAETREELELLETHTGPFVDFLKDLGAWDGGGLADLGELIRIHRNVPHVAFAHGNYLASGPISPENTVIYCPRTHSYFGHAPHPFAEMLARGVCVAL